ncbi:unnamed protein product [Effrenium voratum]|uniref:Uncharacterized protein n=1 Tax=Effrenium voratum TaxID=2562239 RepID=A0AA36I7L7_9DINO|nr:unnamed protein product [Effrenium voratum]CAJ1425781.1 unnamed protein product [Effrenium voratum]
MNHCLVLAALVAALGEAARDGERSVTNQVGELQDQGAAAEYEDAQQQGLRTLDALWATTRTHCSSIGTLPQDVSKESLLQLKDCIEAEKLLYEERRHILQENKETEADYAAELLETTRKLRELHTHAHQAFATDMMQARLAVEQEVRSAESVLNSFKLVS